MCILENIALKLKYEILFPFIIYIKNNSLDIISSTKCQILVCCVYEKKTPSNEIDNFDEIACGQININ